MIALLHDAAVIHHQDQVRVLHGGDPLGDDDLGGLGDEAPEALADEPVGLGVDGRTYLKVALPGGYLRLTSIQLAGKKRMPVADFLRGAHVEGAVLQ